MKLDHHFHVEFGPCEVGPSHWILKTFIVGDIITRGTIKVVGGIIFGCDWIIVVNCGGKLIIGQRLGFPIFSFTRF